MSKIGCKKKLTGCIAAFYLSKSLHTREGQQVVTLRFGGRFLSAKKTEGPTNSAKDFVGPSKRSTVREIKGGAWNAV